MKKIEISKTDYQKSMQLQEECLRDIAPLIALKSEFKLMYSRMLYYPSTGETCYEYPESVQLNIDALDELISMKIDRCNKRIK